MIYAIYTGSEPDMRTEHLTKWLKIYHDQFSYELNVFGYDANKFYPFAKFQQDVSDLFPIGLTWAFIVSEVTVIILYNLNRIFDVGCPKPKSVGQPVGLMRSFQLNPC